MYELIVEAIARGGYLGIFLLMAIENVFPPIPMMTSEGIGGKTFSIAISRKMPT